MNERLNGVTTFVQVVDSGSFAQAALKLGQTRSAVGKTVARLEKRLGVRLFHRTTRQQSLTEDGQAYHEHCVRALAELVAVEASFDSSRREPTGRLRIGAPVLFGRHCVAPVMLALMQRHPQLEIEMSFSDRVVDLVDEGFDLGVRVGELPSSDNLMARRLGVQHMAICAAPSYLSRHGRPQSAEQLDGHAGIVYARAGSDKGWPVRSADGSTYRPRVNTRLRLDDLQAIADAAVAGTGLAWLPCWLLALHVRAGELELVLDGQHVLPTNIHAVWPRTRHLPLKTRVAIDALAAEVPAMLGAEWPGSSSCDPGSSRLVR